MQGKSCNDSWNNLQYQLHACHSEGNGYTFLIAYGFSFRSNAAVWAEAFDVPFWAANTGTDFLEVVLFKCQYLKFLLSYNKFFFFSLQSWTSVLKIFHNFVYCSITWHCWHVIFLHDWGSFVSVMHTLQTIMQFNALCSTENISQMHWSALYKTQRRPGLPSHIPTHKL